MSSTSAVFVGDGSLLVRCTQAWRDAGHLVTLVASHEHGIEDWARAQALPFVRLEAGATVDLPPADFDYLFSVANLTVLPEALIRRARRLAVNFHDGPLPRYAGLNATSWALMAGETKHAVTWHEMTSAVDAGRIVRQEAFDIAPGETALSLNARCYEAGLASFMHIVRDAASANIALTPQGTGGSYFSRDSRPALLGTLDFSRPAREIVAMVRALDFGNYANPLGRAKLFDGSRLVVVRAAQLPASRSPAAPGTVIGSAADSLTIATADGDVLLTGLTGMDGEPARLPPAGSVLPAIDGASRHALHERAPRIGRGERHWLREFAQLAPLELPYPRTPRAPRSLTGPGAAVRAALHVPARGAHTLAAFIAWAAALTGQERISVSYHDAALAEQALAPWLHDRVPLTLATTPHASVRSLVQDAQRAIDAARAAGSVTADLHLRLGDKHPPLELVGRIGMCIGADDLPPGCELMLAAAQEDAPLVLVADETIYAPDTVQAMAHQLRGWIEGFDESVESVRHLPLPIQGEPAGSLGADAALPYDMDATMHGLIAAQAASTPERIALRWHGESLTWRELDQRSTALAARLMQQGVQAGDIVGLHLPRTPELVISLLAVLKAGAAYLPLDPDYPADRIAFMVEDSRARLVLEPGDVARIEHTLQPVDLPAVRADSAAYVIYTSGSTGKPKGVVVTHRNVANFFAGMDPRINHEAGSRWLAVTSLSFDISVLELCWTLARGITVVLHSNVTPADAGEPGKAGGPRFSLFYFASDHASTAQDRYRLLMEGAKYADQNGFAAVWTPERHFHAFGGLYPNPAVTSAAIAAATTRIQIRAGSCVLPLHHPIRVAEEWAFVDNISQGRVGISFASGWQPNDFVIAPQAFANRKEEMLANIDVVRRLWRGEKIAFPGPNGKPVEVTTLPRPIQKELPVWVTAAGNPETFRQAGELGCHLLTHLLGQTVEDVAEKLRIYRMAWHQAGHAGEGHVTLMLHSFVGDDDASVRETVRQPMKEYLRSSVDLIRQAAWSFPTFVQRGSENGKSPLEIMESAPLSDDEMDALLEHAFNRYYGTSALFGTPQRCLAMVQKLQAAGVDEIACLIDFGIDTQRVLDHLPRLKALMDAASGLKPAMHRASVAEDIVRHQVTHLQCTPSMASMLVADTAGREALSRLSALMVGGEALPLKLAQELRALVPGQLINMYGPTETTIWSTTCELKQIGDFVPLGEPIANTQLRVRTPWGMECPVLVPGELLIGGDGVAQGYLGRPELTAERFVAIDGARFYRTGDLVRRHVDGTLEFLGRIDHQVKIRGHRIELGEIEAALLRQPGVKDAVAIARDQAGGDKRLVAYVTAAPGSRPDTDQLRKALAADLPEVMVPQTVLLLASFPMTPNGKVDRRALPEPMAIPVRAAAATPSNDLEKIIAGIWQDVLGMAEVGTSDNFFDLGGHSLLVVQVQRRLREACGREVSITDMFRLPTIKSLAAHLGGEAPAASAVGDGLARAQARRMMRSRSAAQNSANPAA